VDALETQAGTVFGTPRYMSPEQAQGKALDARSDLYSLGVLLYQMLVGRAPFVDDDAVVVMARHIKTMPVAPAIAAPELAIPPSISEVVMRALAKDPGDRPGSARAFITQLEQAAARPRSDRPPHDDVTAASGELGALSRDDLATAGAEARRAPRRRPVVWLGSAALVVVAAGLGATALARSPLALLTARGGLEFAVLTRAAQVRTAATEVAVAPEAPASAASYEAPPPPPPAAATGASKVGHPKGEHKPTKQRYRRFDQ
jgi:serine/threonine-protein kinase